MKRSKILYKIPLQTLLTTLMTISLREILHNLSFLQFVAETESKICLCEA